MLISRDYSLKHQAFVRRLRCDVCQRGGDLMVRDWEKLGSNVPPGWVADDGLHFCPDHATTPVLAARLLP
jgi:hypothetical protein